MGLRLKVMSRVLAGIAAGAALIVACPAPGQDSLPQRLSSDRPGQVDGGSYLAGDHLGFTIDRAGADYLLRFETSPEVFVLRPDDASLGGKVLKYDTGETAVQVSGWGGVTVYTDSDPAGLPAMRTGDANIAEPPTTSLAELESGSVDATASLAHERRLDIAFSTDWTGLSTNTPARALALDAMENVARGIDRFARRPQAREALLRRVKSVMLTIAGLPTVTLNAGALTVTFDPDQGYKGVASSRAISRALASLIPASQKQS